MKKLKLEIEVENDEMKTRDDLAWALRVTARKMQQGGVDGGKIMDKNGNSVGKWEIVKE